MRKSKKLAFSAVLASLGVVVILLGTYLQVLDMTAVAVSSLIIMMAVIELGGIYPWLIWLVTGVLAFLLVPDKLGAVLYIAFGGVYPIFKSMFERLHYVVSWVLKLSFFNTSLTVCILLTRYVLSLPDAAGFDAVLYIIGNIVFVIYDFAASGLITFYLVKLRQRLGLGNYFKS